MPGQDEVLFTTHTSFAGGGRGEGDTLPKLACFILFEVRLVT